MAVIQWIPLAYQLTIRSIEQWASAVTETTLDAAERVTDALEQFYTVGLTREVDTLAYDSALYRALIQRDRVAAREALRREPLDEADAAAVYDRDGGLWLTHPEGTTFPLRTEEFLPPLHELRRAKEEVIVASVPIEDPASTGNITLSELFICAFPIFDDDTRAFYGVVAVAKRLPFSRVVNRERQAFILAQKKRAHDRAVRVLFLAGGCLIVATFVLSHWLSRRMARPVEMLVEGTRAIARGNLDYRVEEPSASEFAYLARAFNQMAFELQQQQDALRRMEKAQAWQEVAQKLAHELKNPLTPIQLAAQRLRRRYSSPKEGFGELLEQCTEVILRQVASLNTLLDEFSRLARLPEPVLAPVPLGDLLANVIASFPELDNTEGNAPIQVEQKVPEDLPPLLADSEQMQRVFHNLIKNAIEAMPEGGTLTITARRKESETPLVEVWVDDTGVGVAPEVRERLFVPHVSTKKDGHGLGLAIVWKIVEDHRGTITVEPNPEGVGTRVTLLLRAATLPESSGGG